jgi:hypothetical protein
MIKFKQKSTMRNFFIFLALSLSLQAIAQNTFFTIYNTHQTETTFDVIQLNDGSFIIVGKRSTTSTEEDVCGLIMKVDENGNLLKEITLINQNRTYYFIIDSVPNSDNEYVVMGAMDSIVGDELYSSIIICRIDGQLNIISQHNFHRQKNYKIYPWKHTFTNDSTMMLLIDSRTNTQPTSPAIIVTEVRLPADSIRSFIAEPEIVSMPGDIIYVPESDEFHVAYFGGFLTDLWDIKILRLDHKLNKIESLQSPERMFSTPSITKLTDSTYLLTATADIQYGYASVRGISTYVMDKNGNGMNGTQFYNHPDTILYGGWKSNTAIVNNSIFITGVYNIDPGSVPWQSTPTWVQITKLDMDLNILSDYFYGGDAVYYPYCILPTRDDGALITGVIWDFQVPKQHDIFAMKVNSDGIIVNVPENASMQTTEAILYPNPTREQITVDFSRLYNSATLQLMDISGKTVFTTQLTSNRQTIDISALPAGTYLYRICNTKGLEETGKLVVK